MDMEESNRWEKKWLTMSYLDVGFISLIIKLIRTEIHAKVTITDDKLSVFLQSANLVSQRYLQP